MQQHLFIQRDTLTFPWQSNGMTVHHGDCGAILPTLPDASVHLVVTSPPYNVGLVYDGYDDRREDYEQWALSWLTACHRVLTRDGRMCLNIPLDTSVGGALSSSNNRDSIVRRYYA